MKYAENLTGLSASGNIAPWVGMPSTRYQGSKRKLLPALYQIFRQLSFDSALDAFGGTGSVTHLLSQMGKQVVYNDILTSSAISARALFGIGDLRIESTALSELFEKKQGVCYGSIIEDIYEGVFFTDEENRQLDCLCGNILRSSDSMWRAESWYILFQSMLSKRPYNLFHRANLDMRMRDVARSFGNKSTWDKPFLEHMQRFWRELKLYREQYSHRNVSIENGCVFQCSKDVDLVYFDPPYARGSKRSQETDYFSFYHFLDAVLDYWSIPTRVSSEFKHRPLYSPARSWHGEVDLLTAFEMLCKRFADRIMVFSYRADGYPSASQLTELFSGYFRRVGLHCLGEYKYVLSTSGSVAQEMVWVCEP
jgi:adenine-specific DNA-methyltransferase